MTLTVEIDPARRTAAFREVSFLAAGDSCRVVLDGVRGADFGSLALLLYRDAASESPVASCSPFSQVAGHPALADGELALDTAEMAAWFADAVPAPEESDDSDDGALPRASASAGPRLAARASLAERSVRADGWLVVLDRDRTWAACRVPVLLRPGAAGHGASDPTSVRALVEGLVSAALAGKADKVPSASAGNLASLDASGNLLDSGATPASIKAAAVAEVVANAPGTMDTLKEIADILGSAPESGTVMSRISALESGKVDKVAGKGLSSEDFTAEEKQKLSSLSAQVPADWSQADSTAPDFIKNKPAIPVVPTLAAVATSGSYNDLTDKPGTFPPATHTHSLSGVLGLGTVLLNKAEKDEMSVTPGTGADADKTTIQLKSGTSATVLAQHQDISGKANASDVNAALAQKASLADLPYRLVELTTPTEWVFSGVEEWFEITSGPDYSADQQGWYLSVASVPQGWIDDIFVSGASDATSLTFTVIDMDGEEDDATVVVTKTGYALLDRAGNRVVVSGDTTLTLPAANPGYLRDFLVRLEISGSTVPTITFAAPTGETITYETDGDEFLVPDEAGNWLYSFTESCVAHKFAVSLKKVNEVAQGGE